MGSNEGVIIEFPSSYVGTHTDTIERPSLVATPPTIGESRPPETFYRPTYTHEAKRVLGVAVACLAIGYVFGRRRSK